MRCHRPVGRKGPHCKSAGGHSLGQHAGAFQQQVDGDPYTLAHDLFGLLLPVARAANTLGVTCSTTSRMKPAGTRPPSATTWEAATAPYESCPTTTSGQSNTLTPPRRRRLLTRLSPCNRSVGALLRAVGGFDSAAGERHKMADGSDATKISTLRTRLTAQSAEHRRLPDPWLVTVATAFMLAQPVFVRPDFGLTRTRRSTSARPAVTFPPPTSARPALAASRSSSLPGGRPPAYARTWPEERVGALQAYVAPVHGKEGDLRD